jgi:hypothetical protein
VYTPDLDNEHRALFLLQILMIREKLVCLQLNSEHSDVQNEVHEFREESGKVVALSAPFLLL